MEKLEIKFNKSKNPLAKSRFFDVEPRGIEPLYPSTNHEFLTRGGPLDSTKVAYNNSIQKESPGNNARTFGTLIESVVGSLSLANLLN